MQCKILFAQFPFFGSTHPDVSDWLTGTILKCKADPRVQEIQTVRVDDTPITASRNRVCKQAKDRGFDLIGMVDADMKPDAYLPANPNKLCDDPLAKPFWETAFDHWWSRKQPACYAAPYQGPPPFENCYYFQWTAIESDNPNFGYKLEQFTREQAAVRSGIEEIAALPTGLILIDVKALDFIQPPWFRYQYTDRYETHRTTTEDVFFTRDLSLAGVPQYILWDSWAGHWKRKCVGKPVLLSVDHIREDMRQAVLRNQPADRRLVMWGEGKDEPPDRVKHILDVPEVK